MFKVQQLLSATTLYRSGTPFHTHSTVTQIDQSRFESCSEVTHFTCAETDGGVTLELRLDAADSVYGLGQTTGPVNRRGGRYRSYSKQAVPHTPGTAALNGAHPFFLLDGARRLGVFLDYPSSASFDIGFTDPDRLTITIPSVDFDLYVIEGDTTQSIIREFLTLVGTPYLPPKWGFGYHQCRFSYMDSDEVREVITGFETLDIPLDALYLDIDYMDDYRVFTADPQRFGDLPELVAELREKGIEVVPILDPGVQIREGYSVYEEGKRSNLFCIDREGNDFVGTVWPGPVHLPDFMNARCRTWWGTLHRRFTEIGIRGFWNDMNEPELFFTGRGIDRLRHAVASARTHEFRGTDAIDFVREVSRFWNTEDDYADLFHRGESGEVLAHEQVHNLYGFFMARATAEGLQALMPDTRYFLLSRSSTIGLHRIGAIWTGDNSSWWEHLQDHMRLMISLNLCGFFYCGADVGGHIGDVSAELMVRWMQLGAFSPLFRNHSQKGSRRQEPWTFTPSISAIMRETIRLRYALLPYTYSEFLGSVTSHTPFISHLSLHFDSARVRQIDDQFLYGGSIMVAPVYEPNARGRFVHLPSCRWLHWNAARWDERRMAVYEPGDHFIAAPLEAIPLFLRENTLVPIAVPSASRTEHEKLDLLGFVTDRATYLYRFDDGYSYGFQRGIVSEIEIIVERRGGDYQISCAYLSRSAGDSVRELRCMLYDERGMVEQTVRIR